jgi:type IV pilus assembly protein PilW
MSASNHYLTGLRRSAHNPDLKSSFQAGFTIIELLVALALSAVIAMAAVASLSVARQGFNAVDASSQLRDSGRFATDLIQRLAVQSGYQDVNFAASTRVSEFSVKGASTNPEPNVVGVDNAVVKQSLLPDISTAFLNRNTASSSVTNCTATTDTACANGSDVLILRYQSSASVVDSTTTDGTMINCAGAAETQVPASKDDKIISIFHVARSSNGDPSLMCSYLGAGGTWTTQPVVQGVESFQVLYGIDGYSGSVNSSFTGPQDTVPDKYLRAEQIVVGGTPDSVATYNNWRRVQSLRIGLILRGPKNSAIDKTAPTIAKICPLGVDPDTPANCIDQGSGSTSMGSEFPRATTIPNDGRLRQAVTFTVFLRNVQSQ